MVGYSGTLLHAVLLGVASPDPTPPSLGPALAAWGEMLHRLTSHTDTDSDILLACAHAVRCNSRNLLHAGELWCFIILTKSLHMKQSLSTILKKILHHFCLCIFFLDFPVRCLMFRCVLDLLMADDLEVRETTASVLTVISQDYKSGTVFVSNIIFELVSLNFLRPFDVFSFKKKKEYQ